MRCCCWRAKRNAKRRLAVEERGDDFQPRARGLTVAEVCVLHVQNSLKRWTAGSGIQTSVTNISHEAIKSETMDGLEWDSDPTAHVLSANVHRRHLTKGQQAMAIALAYPNPEERGRGKKSLIIKDFNINQGYLSQARFVLRHCRDKAEEVLRNAKYPLTVAYEEAQAIVRLIHRSHLSTIRCIKNRLACG